LKKYIIALSALSLFITEVAFAEQYKITLVVLGAAESEGQILASLFNSKASYLKEAVAEASAIVDSDGRVELDFGVHDPGEYAVAVVYDRNSNGELDTGFLKIPKEKIGFSNNAKSRFGPAKWKAARFQVADMDVEVGIELKHVKHSESAKTQK